MVYTALYRKFRPQVFEEVVGQEHVTTTLKNQIIGGRVAHAYLFAGTRGTGKTSTAKIFARAVNCTGNKGGNPCNGCALCGGALSGKLIDIIEIDAASNRGVDEIRDLREKVKYPPSEGKYKVYIVDEVHMLTMEAFNALLKTLEEPPAHVIFVLATTEPHKLPATILSRCQRFDFRRISVLEIMDRLRYIARETALDADEDALRVIAVTADGALRDAISLLDQCTTFQKGRLTPDRVATVLGIARGEFLTGISKGLANRDAVGCIGLLNDAVEEGKDIGQLFKDIIHHCRDLMIARISPSSLTEMTPERRETLERLAAKMDTNMLIRAINVLSEAEAKAKWSSQPKIYLEVALIKLCEPSMDSSIEGLKDRISRLEAVILDGGDAKEQEAEPRRPEGKAVSSTPITEDGAGKPVPERPKPQEIDKQKDDDSEKEESAGSEAQVSLEQVKGIWEKVLKHLAKNKKGLYTLINNSRPLEVKGTLLVIGCEALHGICYDIVNSKDNIQALQGAVESNIGVKLDIQIESLDKTPQQPKRDAAQQDIDLVEEAIRVFGKELVEVIEEEDI